MERGTAHHAITPNKSQPTNNHEPLTTLRFAYRKEFATEPVATALRRRGWETIPLDDPAQALLDGTADIVLTPAVDYARSLGIIDYALVPGVAIMTQGFAGLLKLLFNKGLASFATVAVKQPESSEGTIARIILSEKHDLRPRLVRSPSDASVEQMLGAADAALLVGDEAIFESGGRRSLLDLSDEWEDTAEAPLPYMLAWGRISEVPQAALDEMLEAREQAGLLLADQAAQSDRREQANEFYQRYLRGDIRYALEPADLQALDAFFRYAFYHSEIQDIPAIKFLPEGEPGA